MRVAVCSSFAPFVNGGARLFNDWLVEQLRQRGHQVDLINLPFQESPDELLQQMMAYRMIDLSDRVDRLITTRPPAHMIRHPRKVSWFIHHLRRYYDLWESPYRGFPDDARHRALRDALMRADTVGLGESHLRFTNSRVVADRVKKYNGLDSEVLYPPLLKTDQFRCDGQAPAVVYVCRVERHKRQHLLVEAFRHVREPLVLRIGGSTSDEAYAAQLKANIVEWGLSDRVEYVDGWISEQQKADWLATSLMAAYIPLDEDSYGYPCLEAAHAEKPVLTLSDSGGVLELIEHGNNGVVVEPEPLAIAEAIEKMWSERQATAQMGVRAKQRLKEIDINWNHVVERLLA